MRKFITLRRIGILALAIFGLIMLSLFLQIENWQRDLSINYASLDAESDDPRMHPPVMAGSITEVADRIADWAERTPRWSVVSKQVSDSGAKIHLARTTRIFRWVDDVQVQLNPLDGGVQVNAESKSRVGKADFGQNPRNLRELLAGIR